MRTLPNARFYITLGAAKQLRRRQASLLVRSQDYSDEQVMRAVVDLSLQRNKPLLDLTEHEAQQDLDVERSASKDARNRFRISCDWSASA